MFFIYKKKNSEHEESDDLFHTACFNLDAKLRNSINHHLASTSVPATSYLSCVEFFRGRTRNCGNNIIEINDSFYIVHGLRWGHNLSMFQVWTDSSLIASMLSIL